MSFIIIFIIVLIALCFVVITSALLNFFSCVWTQSATFRVQSIASALRRTLCVNEDPTSGKEEEKKKTREKKARHLSSLVSAWSAKPLRLAWEAVVSDAGL